MKKDKEDKEKERIKSATNLLRKERIDFRNRCKEKIHVGDMVEIANPTEILNNCKYAVLVEKGQDADFDEAIIDVNSSHVFLVDSFKSIYSHKPHA